MSAFVDVKHWCVFHIALSKMLTQNEVLHHEFAICSSSLILVACLGVRVWRACRKKSIDHAVTNQKTHAK